MKDVKIIKLKDGIVNLLNSSSVVEIYQDYMRFYSESIPVFIKNGNLEIQCF